MNLGNTVAAGIQQGLKVMSKDLCYARRQFKRSLGEHIPEPKEDVSLLELHVIIKQLLVEVGKLEEASFESEFTKRLRKKLEDWQQAIRGAQSRSEPLKYKR